MRRVRQLLYRIFGRIPWPIQRAVIGVVQPSFVVGATAVVVAEDGRILLVRHSYKPGWSTPGGFVDRWETPTDAAEREVWEECGIRVVAEGEPVTLYRPQERILEIVVRARLVDEEAGLRARPVSAEIAEVRWCDQDDLPDLSLVAHNGLTALALAEAERAGFGGVPEVRQVRAPRWSGPVPPAGRRGRPPG